MPRTPKCTPRLPASCGNFAPSPQRPASMHRPSGQRPSHPEPRHTTTRKSFSGPPQCTARSSRTAPRSSSESDARHGSDPPPPYLYRTRPPAEDFTEVVPIAAGLLPATTGAEVVRRLKVEVEVELLLV